jgi:hypothetical protein
MARILVNGQNKCPTIIITTNVVPLGTDYTVTFDPTVDIIVPYVQNITVNSSTGIYSYTTFCDDTRKLSTIQDNSLSTNIVLDDTTWFGTAYPATPALLTSAQACGLQYIQANNLIIGFKMYWDDHDGVGSGAKFKQGVGWITTVNPTVTPEQPLWISPFEIAVDGAFIESVNP